MPSRSATTIPAYVHITRIERDDMVDYPADIERPRTRGDCLPGGCNEERPCPFVGCRHHLYLDVNPKNGSIKLNCPGLDVEQIQETCSLDVADRHRGLTLDEVGAIMNLTSARTQQIEAGAVVKLYKRTLRRGIER